MRKINYDYQFDVYINDSGRRIYAPTDINPLWAWWISGSKPVYRINVRYNRAIKKVQNADQKA